MDLKGKQIEFSGQHGLTRNGIILKTWTSPKNELWAHVQAKPYYVWERPQDCIFVVALDEMNIDHNKCVVHGNDWVNNFKA
jgi:hypothetical protein